MQENLTLEEEEIVHENAVVELPFKSKFARIIIYVIGIITLFGLPALAHYCG